MLFGMNSPKRFKLGILLNGRVGSQQGQMVFLSRGDQKAVSRVAVQGGQRGAAQRRWPPWPLNSAAPARSPAKATCKYPRGSSVFLRPRCLRHPGGWIFQELPGQPRIGAEMINLTCARG